MMPPAVLRLLLRLPLCVKSWCCVCLMRREMKKWAAFKTSE
jgi:hypothetical protein